MKSWTLFIQKFSLQDAVAQDANRVKLAGQANDYINATRMPGPSKGGYLDQSWIVTQGPLDNTIEDFWRLVWQENTRLIVMLTKTFEVVRLMCSQYWPLHVNTAGDNYGVFNVRLVKEETFAHYKIRKFMLKCTGDGGRSLGSREVTQFHFTSWPLSARPDITSLLQFRKQVRTCMDKTSQFGPPLVHCHDGGDRAGTYLAIEANLTYAEHEKRVDSK